MCASIDTVATSDLPHEPMQVRFVGLDITPSKLRSAFQEQRMAQLQKALGQEDFSRMELSPAPPTATPVFADASGDEFILPRGDSEVTLLPWISGSPSLFSGETFHAGGFVSREELGRLADEDQAAVRKLQLTQKELAKAVMKVLRAMGLMKRKKKPKRSAQPGRSNSQPAPETTSQKPEPEKAPGEEGEPGWWDPNRFGIGAGANILATGLGSGTFGAGAIAGGVIGSISSMGINFVIGQMVQKFLPIDENSSTAEVALGTVAPKVAMELLAGPGFEAFRPGPFDAGALREGDMDEKGNSITAGESTVLIEGKPAARDGDPLDQKGNPKATKCVNGAAMVKIGGKIAAREDDPCATYGTQTDMATRFLAKSGAARTFIGGESSNPDTKIPDDLKDAASAKLGDKAPDPNKPHKFVPGETEIPPGEPGYYYQDILGPDGEFLYREWRIWDGKGWSNTLSEFFRIPESIRGTDNWSILGGWIDLGSPMFPGAGTGSVWFVPDTIFGYDMSPYFTYHDWHFGPNELSFFASLNVELNAFSMNLGFDPIRVILQVIYSSATTSVFLTKWWAEFVEQLNLELALIRTRRGKA